MTEELDSFFRSFLLKWISYEMKERQKNVFYKRMEKDDDDEQRKREEHGTKTFFFRKILRN